MEIKILRKTVTACVVAGVVWDMCVVVVVVVVVVLVHVVNCVVVVVTFVVHVVVSCVVIVVLFVLLDFFPLVFLGLRQGAVAVYHDSPG